MSGKKSLTLRKYSRFSAIILAATAFLAAGKDAAALTADDVLNKMNLEQRHAYLTGVVEGLAFARWTADKPDDTGMQCINDWYFGGGAERSNLVNQWLGRHLDKPVSALLYVLIKKECGE